MNKIRFSRNRVINNSRDIAILSLDSRTHLIGQPVIAEYYTNPEKTEIDCVFAIGTKNGKGRDCYRLVTIGQHEILWAIVDSLPDVSSLVHDQLYAYKDGNGDWFYVFLEGDSRKIVPFDSTPHIFLCVADNTIWFSNDDRKLRQINNILTKTEIDALLQGMREFVQNAVDQVEDDVRNAVETSTRAEEKVDEFGVIVREVKEDFDQFKEETEEAIDNIQDDLQAFHSDFSKVATIDEEGHRTGTFDNLELTEGGVIGEIPIATTKDVSDSVSAAKEELQGNIDALEERVSTNETDIEKLRTDVDSFAEFEEDGKVNLHSKSVALEEDSTIGGINIATVKNLEDTATEINNTISQLESNVNNKFSEVEQEIEDLKEEVSGDFSALEERVTTNESNIEELQTWKSGADPVLLELDNKSLGITTTMTGGVVYEYNGALYDAVLNWSFKRDGRIISPTTLELKQGSTVVCSDPTLTSYTVSASAKGSTVFTITGTYKDSLQTKVAASSSQSITLYLPKFVGHSASETLTADEVRALERQAINGNTSGTYRTNTDSDYVWLCFPAEFKEVTGMTSAGFDFIYNDPIYVELIVNETPFGYRCYRSTNRLTGNWTITVTQ